ncbi:MAG: YIP1 family protein [Anaerolineae bacterium]|nr:YIP1 family protein [Anaerolineae bacterium]
MTYESPPEYGYYNQPATGKTPALVIWRNVLFSPSVETLNQYLPEASIGRGLLWWLTSGAVSFLASMLVYALTAGRYMTRNLPPEFQDVMPFEMGGLSVLSTLLCGIPVWIASLLLGAFVMAGLIHLAAKLLKGQGTFTGTFFLLAAASAPLTLAGAALQVVGQLLGLVPVLGIILTLLLAVISLGLTIFALVLSSMAVAAAHRFSLGRGFAALILPYIVLFVLGVCLAVIIVSLIGISAQEILREMGQLLLLYV